MLLVYCLKCDHVWTPKVLEGLKCSKCKRPNVFIQLRTGSAAISGMKSLEGER